MEETEPCLDKLDQLLLEIDDRTMLGLCNRLRDQLYIYPRSPVNELQLFITERCNLRCSYCFLNKEEPQGDMSLEVARQSIDLVSRLSHGSDVFRLVLFGGEPLLRKDLMADILSMAREACQRSERKLSISCTTNGLLLDEAAIDLSHRYGFLYLLSVDGTREVHDSCRRTASGQGSFDLLAEKIMLLKKRQGWIGTRMTVTPHSIGFLAQGVRDLHAMGINQFLIGVQTEVPWSSEQTRLIKDQYRELLLFYIKARQDGAPIRLSGVEHELIAKRTGVWGCGAGRNTVAIDVTGSIYPCARFKGREEYCMGNVSDEQSINWEIGRCLSDQNRLARWKCLHCDLTDYCGGGCPECNVCANGTPYYPSDAHCAYIRAMVELREEMPGIEEMLSVSPEPRDREDEMPSASQPLT